MYTVFISNPDWQNKQETAKIDNYIIRLKKLFYFISKLFVHAILNTKMCYNGSENSDNFVDFCR